MTTYGHCCMLKQAHTPVVDLCGCCCCCCRRFCRWCCCHWRSVSLLLHQQLLPSLQVVRQLIQKAMLPAIWFIMSRRDCDLAAINTNLTLVNQQEEAELEQELQTLL